MVWYPQEMFVLNRVEELSDLRPALQQAFDSNRPVILDVVSAEDAMAPLAFTGDGD